MTMLWAALTALLLLCSEVCAFQIPHNRASSPRQAVAIGTEVVPVVAPKNNHDDSTGAMMDLSGIALSVSVMLPLLGSRY
jgi:hypothetical protein